MKTSSIISEIDGLANKVKQYILPLYANSKEEAEKLNNDPHYYYSKKSKLIKQLPEDLKKEALRVGNMAIKFYEPLIISVDTLKKQIEAINQSILTKENWGRTLSKTGLYSEQDVRNINHVELFVILLPSFDPYNSSMYRKTGLVMAALLFVENLHKCYFMNPKANSTNPYEAIFGLDNIRALYEIANTDGQQA